MFNFTAIVWQNYYNMLLKASKNIKDFNINLYSARVLEKEPQLLKKIENFLKNIIPGHLKR